MKKVVVVFNGRTIPMKVDERIKAAVPSLIGEEIMSMVTGIEEFVEVESHSFSSKPSPHTTIQNVSELSKFTKGLIDREDIDGVVLAHGTDTLEETAYSLDLIIGTEKVIVVTGAMRSSPELGYDGPFNLATSICIAISRDVKGRGVLVRFNGELNSAAEVTKANSMVFNAFKTPSFGPIGIVDNNKVLFYRNIKKHRVYHAENTVDKIALIECVAGMGLDHINYFIDNEYKGIVIKALGRGDVPPIMVDGIKRALDKNIPVVTVSRCLEGRVYESYGYEGGGKALKGLGAFFEESTPGQKARIKLIVALSSKKSIDVRESFKNNTNFN